MRDGPLPGSEVRPRPRERAAGGPWGFWMPLEEQPPCSLARCSPDRPGLGWQGFPAPALGGPVFICLPAGGS